MYLSILGSKGMALLWHACFRLRITQEVDIRAVLKTERKKILVTGPYAPGSR